MTIDRSRQRTEILESCESLRALMASVPRAVILPAMQELGRINVRAQTESTAGLSSVADDLANLIGRLKEQDAGDGSTVINAERWKRFFGDCEN